MGRTKKRQYEKKAFESVGGASDVSANVYESMLTSTAWVDLSAQQKALYLCCKAQYYAERKKPIDGDAISFTMARHKWMEHYRLYKEGNQAAFYRDMQALLDHGFVELVSSGKATREKSIYRFSSMWRKWGTVDFYIPANQQVTSRRKT